MNLLLRHEVKRCNLLLSFVSYRGSCSPGFSWGSLTFPAMFLWLGAHLTPIKPSTCKSTDCSGARWKVCFFPSRLLPPPPNQNSSLQELTSRVNHSEDFDFKTLETVVYLLTISCFGVKLQAVLQELHKSWKNDTAKQRQCCISMGQTLKGSKTAFHSGEQALIAPSKWTEQQEVMWPTHRCQAGNDTMRRWGPQSISWCEP